MSTRQSEENDEADQAYDGDDKDAAFRPGGSSAEYGFTDGVGGEEMVLYRDSAVGDAVEEGLSPVPRGVEADRPPERTGPPEAEAKDHAGQSDRE